MPRWLSSNKMEIVKGILAGAHTCSRAGPQTPSLYVHNSDSPPFVAQMIRPCCTLALLTRPPPTPRLTPRAPTQSPRVDGPRVRRHAQGLPLAPRRRLLQPAAHRRHFAPHRFRVPRKHEQHPRRRRPVGRRRLAVCRLLRHPATERNGGHPRLGPAAHKGVLPRYDSNTRGQLPSRSPR